jgi:hypothetical protein
VLVHPNCMALLSAIIQQAFFAGGLGQEVDRAGFDGSPCHSACNIDPLGRGIGVQN